ncbi:MAG: hypothetical protein ACC657_15165 [Thiohalomonadales bacterium]
MLNKIFKIVYLISILTLFLTACGHEDDDDNETYISSNGGQKSHNTGQNCLSCHKSGNEVIFTVAGTVYQIQDLTLVLPNVKIQFHDGPNTSGNLIHSIDVDALGNFYTTNALSWGNGLYVSVVVPDGVTNSMSFVVTEGECGRCHGVNENQIYG